MTLDFNIRPAEKQDLAAIGAIADQTELFPSDMLADMVSPYLNNSPTDIWFVGKANERVVTFGFCEAERMTDGTWNLLAIGVLPDHQGQGIGAKMMAYIEGLLRQSAQRILLVETMGTEAFDRTRQFYRNVGYTEEARIRDFYEPGGDKTVFWKRL